MAGNMAPIIVKRKKKAGGDGHHGGAWKVAYADFVTAMMAFFLLMWLIGATTDDQRKGIADYFSTSIPLIPQSGGGNSAFGGDSVFSAQTKMRHGEGAAVKLPDQQTGETADSGDGGGDEAGDLAANAAGLAAVESLLAGAGGESLVSEQLMRHVITRQTDEGLIIELHDLPNALLFERQERPSPLLQELLSELAVVLDLVTNDIAIGGHVAARPIVATGIDPWALSGGRADAARRLLEEAGLNPDRIARVTGFADRKPVTANGMAPRNARLEIVLLRSRY